ncbi:efflux RND transporter periplasmic adaptor subunit [Agrobacterium radiobacter]|uniref:NolF secretion protein n=1 Tax=Agrobacterium tumefaciens str. B6 TaxID=1183423 RepID=A0A822V7B1_AGRTU|nr:efflux RND transporter periplasmic adaptor subunit [Agrobacterium tumefaciens]MQB26632.1 efflux RND transporter periplasmic adaptor subunit [Agrobacterium tumefaciens]NTA08054.1 efflux RND transporter periplasmic adaptor subunit [Agrobacterium tumefaciens]NTA94450.1 efflux RND transporter periplasmic adaptor subunit [Agrobacterium tumefaciens]NTB15658.1 efflux RND transporter periplasmic adaptor subunit [Agrobacterium tumefaciens]OCJ27893.1 efflux transporter periplasmic adaptor subunit [Ag
MWVKRTIKAGIALAGCVLVVTALDPARGSVDANERVKGIVNGLVETASMSPAGTPFELTAAETAKIGTRAMVERLGVSGELQPITRVVIRAREAGKIVEMNVRDGDAVQAGKLLVRFETDELQSTLLLRQSDRDAAEAELMLAMQALTRTEQLALKNIASTEQLDKAKSDVAVKTARLQSLSAQADIARLALRNAEIRAPFSGTVTRRLAEAGSRVGADGELLTLVDTSVLEAKVLVATRDIPRVALGQTAELEIDGLGGQIVKGTVDRISPVAEDGTRFVAVYLRLANRDGRLWGGMFASGSILLREKNDALVVPAIALRKDETGYHVLKVEDGRLRRQTVAVGARWNDGSLVEIAAGLKDGEIILTAPLPELGPDMAVTIDKAG